MRKLSELEWFDVKDYSSVHEMGAHHWLAELSIRLACYSHSFSEKTKAPIFDPLKTDATTIIELQQAVETYSDIGHWVNDEFCLFKPITTSANFNEYELAVAIEDMPIRHIPAGSNVDQASNLTHAYYIDFDAPDEALMIAFEQLLKGSRTAIKNNPALNKAAPPLDNKNKIKHITEELRKKWGQFGLLPCLDLMQWERVANERISNEALGALLTHEPLTRKVVDAKPDRAKQIRETTKKYVSKVPSYVQTLQTQVRGNWMHTKND